MINISIVIGIISIIAFFLNPLAIIGVLIAIVIGIFAIKSNKESETTEKKKLML